jgi:hypothetical protein
MTPIAAELLEWVVSGMSDYGRRRRKADIPPLIRALRPRSTQSRHPSFVFSFAPFTSACRWFHRLKNAAGHLAISVERS